MSESAETEDEHEMDEAPPLKGNTERVPGQRVQLRKGSTLDEVFRSAQKGGGSEGEPREPLRGDSVRSASELDAVIHEAGVRYEECGRLSVSLDWWNRNSAKVNILQCGDCTPPDTCGGSGKAGVCGHQGGG